MGESDSAIVPDVSVLRRQAQGLLEERQRLRRFVALQLENAGQMVPIRRSGQSALGLGEKLFGVFQPALLEAAGRTFEQSRSWHDMRMRGAGMRGQDGALASVPARL